MTWPRKTVLDKQAPEIGQPLQTKPWLPVSPNNYIRTISLTGRIITSTVARDGRHGSTERSCQCKKKTKKKQPT